LLITPLPLAILSAFLLTVPITKLILFQESARMTLRQGLIHCVTIGITTFVTRHSAPQRILSLLLQKQPNESVIFASFLVIWGLSCLPLSYKYFPHLIFAKKLNMLILLAGFVLLFLQPELDYGEVFNSFRQTFGGTVASANRLSYLNQGEFKWTIWPVIIGIIFNLGLLLPTPALPLRNKFWRFLHIIFTAICLSLYIGGALIPFSPLSPLLMLAYIISSALFVAFFSYFTWPVPGCFVTLRRLNYFFILSYGILLFMERSVFSAIPLMGKEIVIEAHYATTQIYCLCHFLMALFINQYLSQEEKPATPKPKKILSAMVKEQAFGGPFLLLGSVGNLSVIFTFTSALYLCISYFETVMTGLLVISPIWLLLNPDTYLFKWLNSQNRYFPLALVLSVGYTFLSFIDLYNLWFEEVSWFYFSKNLFLSCVSLPSLYYIVKYLGDFHVQDNFLWYNLSPINLLSILFCDLLSGQLLALFAVSGAILRYVVSERIRKASLRYL